MSEVFYHWWAALWWLPEKIGGASGMLTWLGLLFLCLGLSLVCVLWAFSGFLWFTIPALFFFLSYLLLLLPPD